MHVSPVPSLNLRYLTKVLFGLTALALWVAAAIWLPSVANTSPGREITVGVLILGMLALVRVVHWLYGHADELQQAIHQIACARSLPWLTAACGAIGVLQANDLLPVFNQLWMMGFLVAMWGLQLMLADRPHH